MKLVINHASDTTNFRTYALKENKVYCLTILGLMLLEFIIFKICYPYPDFFSDSYSYIGAAQHHQDVNIWPIGYSRFLALFHWFTYSGKALIFFQYFFFAFSALYFYLTITYFFPLGKTSKRMLCVFLFFNPLFLYTANYVTSDILFISMSTIWLTQLIWILQRPSLYQVFVQAGLVFIMFTFRYNAMIYPFIAACVFLLSKQRVWIKTLGIILAPILITPFILWSSNAAKKLTGTTQFPPILGGWQWGNNALYMRGFIEEDSTAFPTPQTAELDRIARQYFSLPSRPQDQLAGYVANFFIRQPEAPLKQYMSKHFQPVHHLEYVAAWGKSAVVFDQYGKFLIKRHPLAFARYYLLVNSKNYFIPPLEKLEVYNLGEDYMWDNAQDWFHYNKPSMWCISKELQGTILAPFPLFFLLLNIYYAFSLFLFYRRNGIRSAGNVARFTILIIFIFLLTNAAFSIFANIIVIRYQIFPMLVILTFSLLQMDYVTAFTENGKETAKTNPLQTLSVN